MSFLIKIKEKVPKSVWDTGKSIKNTIYKWKYRTLGRPFVPGETSKAYQRRLKEGFFEKYCSGRGLDVGFGGDLVCKNADGYDFEHGDAQYLSNIKDEMYDFLYSSHTLEHLPDPKVSLKNWYRVIKKGGYLIVSIPHRDLYEKKKTLPSRFNPYHLNYFLIENDEAPDTIGVLPLLEKTISNYELIYIKECSDGLTITDPLKHSNGEYSIEFVLRKK
ncbi:MAG: class I SAM-dependent methyltransferase [Ignavibacteriaceae bacterium]|nr:class I SAM-dependent methyltransferase [Ignavibacteriaceae bacterium]